MNKLDPYALPRAPAALLDAGGQPLFGRYSGHVPSLDWQGLQAPWKKMALLRQIRHKRWRYLALATEEIFCGIAIVDLGWASTAFAYVFERAAGRELAAFSQDGLPVLSARVSQAPLTGADCRFEFGGKRIQFQHIEGGSDYQLQLSAPGMQIEARFAAESAAPALLAVGKIAGGSVHATQKSAGMPLRGQVQCGTRRFVLDGGVGSFDHSSGILQRDTEWRWASAHSLELGFNLQQGYFADQENALWCGGQVYPLAAAHFQFDPARADAPWQIHTEDGLLELEFMPEGARRQNKNLGIAISRYLQPVGRFSGWVRAHAAAPKVQVSNLLGVTEDHFSRW